MCAASPFKQMNSTSMNELSDVLVDQIAPTKQLIKPGK